MHVKCLDQCLAHIQCNILAVIMSWRPCKCVTVKPEGPRDQAGDIKTQIFCLFPPLHSPVLLSPLPFSSTHGKCIFWGGTYGCD